MRNNYYTVFNQRLAGHLMTKGFRLLAIIPNQNNERNRFLFNNSDILRDVIDEWNVNKLSKN